MSADRHRFVRMFLRTMAATLMLGMSAGPQAPVQHQQNVVIRGGWLFTATGNTVIRTRGILVVAGRLMAVDRAILA